MYYIFFLFDVVDDNGDDDEFFDFRSYFWFLCNVPTRKSLTNSTQKIIWIFATTLYGSIWAPNVDHFDSIALTTLPLSHNCTHLIVLVTNQIHPKHWVVICIVPNINSIQLIYFSFRFFFVFFSFSFYLHLRNSFGRRCIRTIAWSMHGNYEAKHRWLWDTAH